MSAYADVRKGLRNVALSALSDFTSPVVIFSNLNGSEPAESYVVVNILSIIQQGRGRYSILTNTVDEVSVSSVYEVLCQYSFVGSQSGDMIQSFDHMLNSPIVLEEISRNNLGLMRKSPVRRSPQKRDTQWTEYCNMDLTFNYIVNTQQVVDTVEHVIIQNIDGTVITIPPLP